MNPQTMTLDKCRDELARMDGWNKWHVTTTVDGVERRGRETWHDPRSTKNAPVFGPHPHPATLDGAAAALPEGWLVRVTQEPRYKLTPHWLVNAVDIHEDGGRGYVMIDAEGPDELTARYRLALACRIAEEGK